jgi:mRNA interferase RelE/StbE
MRRLDITNDAHGFLTKLDAKPFRQIMLSILALLKEPQPHDSKLLTGYPYWRVSAGEYRVVYSFDDVCLFIILVGKRNDNEVYKKLERK